MYKKKILFKDLKIRDLIQLGEPFYHPNALEALDQVYNVKKKIAFMTEGGYSIELNPENEFDYVNFNSDEFITISKNNVIYNIFYNKIIGYVLTF
ncbi:MAG: hypothetical protein FWF54_07385 [Candidatus Azobacteroides sp.]|nr:hypothetical protein [Candidatus Azobacteroides sp.]